LFNIFQALLSKFKRLTWDLNFSAWCTGEKKPRVAFKQEWIKSRNTESFCGKLNRRYAAFIEKKIQQNFLFSKYI
jgi:hypothetical protein